MSDHDWPPMNTDEAARKAASILHTLATSHPDVIAGVICGLCFGFWDEWDCEFDYAVRKFGPIEWRVAARAGAESLTPVEGAS